MRDQQLKQTSTSRSRRLRPSALRSFIAGIALALIALAWWVGLLGPNHASIVGGFGTLFILIAAVCLAIGFHRQFSRQR
jgi:protein-S-isoprenylcysteine O-methyltransferase Ste14